MVDGSIEGLLKDNQIAIWFKSVAPFRASLYDELTLALEQRQPSDPKAMRNVLVSAGVLITG